MLDEGVPDFSRSQEWYDIKVYRHKDEKQKKTEVNYNLHLRCVKIATKGINFLEQNRLII